MKKVKIVFTIEVDEEGMAAFREKHGYSASTYHRTDADILANEAISNWQYEGLVGSVDDYEDTDSARCC